MSRLRWNGGLVWVAVLMLPAAAALGRSGGITSSGMEEGPATCGDCHDGPAPGVVTPAPACTRGARRGDTDRTLTYQIWTADMRPQPSQPRKRWRGPREG